MIAEVVTVRGGRMLDTIRVGGNGQVRFATGLGRGVLATMRRRFPDATTAELLEASWSNGYLMTRPA